MTERRVEGTGALGLQQLKVQGFRNLQSIELNPCPGLNIILGDNAAGKTSVLEAIFLLGRPRSFRSGSPRDWVLRGQRRFSIYADLRSAHRRRRLGVGWQDQALERRLDGETAKAAELARLFPVTVFEPSMHGWLEDSPDYRRSLLDWFLFHVEPQFLGVWQRYRRILQQRNAALRQSPTQASNWDEGFLEHSVALDRFRSKALEWLESEVIGSLEALSPGFGDVAVRYRPGGSLEIDSLRQKLSEVAERERVVGTSQTGAHRFDWRFEDQRGTLKRRASRGQQKLLLLAFVLSQAKCIKMSCGLSPVFLLDDFASELDGAHQARTLDSILNLDSQVFVSALGESAIRNDWPSETAVFHVEQGRLVQQPGDIDR